MDGFTVRRHEMKPRIYNTIANLSLIVAVLSTFLWDKAPLLAFLMGAGAALTATVTYFYSRAHGSDSVVEKAEESELAVPRDRSTLVEAPNEAAEVFSKAAMDAAMKVITETAKVWEIHHRQTPAWSLKGAFPSDPMNFEHLLRYMEGAKGEGAYYIDLQEGKFSPSSWDPEEDEPKGEGLEEFLPFGHRRKVLSQ